MANYQDVNRTVAAISPFLTELILRKKERDRGKKISQEKLDELEKQNAKEQRAKFMSQNYGSLDPQTQVDYLNQLGISAPPLPEQSVLDKSRALSPFGIRGSSAAGLVSEGSLSLPGTNISPFEQARTNAAQSMVPQREAVTDLTEIKQQKVQAEIDLLRDKAKLQKQAFSGKTNSDKRGALSKLADNLLREIDLVDSTPENFDSPEEYQEKRKELSDELKEVRTQLRKMGNVPEKQSNPMFKIRELIKMKSRIEPKKYEQTRNSLAYQIKDATGKNISKEQARKMLKELFEIK